MTDLQPTAAIAQIVAPLTNGEAIAHGWLGDRGQGKSTANKVLIDYMLVTSMIRMCFTLDDKTARGTIYKGAMRSTIAHYMNDYSGAGNHIVFRGAAFRRDRRDVVTPGEIGQLAWDVVRTQDIQVLVNIDELGDATTAQGQAWKKDAEPVIEIFTKGRGAGVSIVWTTQLPQKLPLEAFGLSETIGIFRMDGREVNYLAKKNVITDDLVDVIPRLERGQWILYAKGRGGWDGHIYKFRIKNKVNKIEPEDDYADDS